MELKRKNVAPTPRRVRARLPNLAANPETGVRMSDTTMQAIFSTLCYDEDEERQRLGAEWVDTQIQGLQVRRAQLPLKSRLSQVLWLASDLAKEL